MLRLMIPLTIGCALLAAGCSSKPILRDNYVGKSWLQPDNISGPHPRDENGEPILEELPDTEMKKEAAS